MEFNPLVSVIIINFNGKKYLRNCFDSLLNGDYKNIEIIFVDNGSSDGSVDFIKESYSKVIIIDNKVNLGLAVASNRGAQIAKGKYLFFYNNDTIADKELIKKLAGKLESDPSVGICGCRTYTYDGKNIINEGVPCDIFGYPYGKGRVFYVDAAIFMRRDIFFEIGAFDEKMFLYGEDRDLCWRCWLYGYKVAVVKEAVFFHDSACITKDIKQYSTSINKRFLGEFNALRSILKNYSLVFLAVILPMFMAINILEILLFLSRGDLAVVKGAYLRSYQQNFLLSRDTLYRRSQVQKERKISDFQLISHMNKISGKLVLFLKIGLPKVKKDIKYGA